MSYKINYSAEEKIKLAKDDSAEKLYESKKNQRTVRVLTVCAYVLTVSMAAIILSSYYVFLWDPSDASAKNAQHPNIKCDKIIIPQNLAVRLANNTEISAEAFYSDIIKKIQKMQQEAKRARPKDLPKMVRSDFNNYLTLKAIDLQKEEEQRLAKKVLKRMSKKKNHQDDEDFNIEDSEASGERFTTFQSTTSDPSDLNDTTISLDQ